MYHLPLITCLFHISVIFTVWIHAHTQERALALCVYSAGVQLLGITTCVNTKTVMMKKSVTKRQPQRKQTQRQKPKVQSTDEVVDLAVVAQRYVPTIQKKPRDARISLGPIR